MLVGRLRAVHVPQISEQRTKAECRSRSRAGVTAVVCSPISRLGGLHIALPSQQRAHIGLRHWDLVRVIGVDRSLIGPYLFPAPDASGLFGHDWPLLVR